MIKRFAPTVFIFLTAVALALPSVAQDEQEEGRRGGRGGFRGAGGFGGPGGPGGFGRSSDMLMLSLLRVDKVREEIELTPDQEEALQQLGEQRREQRPDFGRFRDASPEERREMMEETRQEIETQMKEAREKISNTLMPEQEKRLNQIAIQAMGVGALSDPKVIAELEITDEQQEKMNQIRQESMNEIREMFSGGNRGDFRERREEMREKLTEVREKSEKEVLAVLTSDQLIALDEMKGEPFELPEDRGGFGRGRGGFGGPGGRDDDGGRRGGRRGGRGDQDN